MQHGAAAAVAAAPWSNCSMLMAKSSTKCPSGCHLQRVCSKAQQIVVLSSAQAATAAANWLITAFQSRAVFGRQPKCQSAGCRLSGHTHTQTNTQTHSCNTNTGRMRNLHAARHLQDKQICLKRWCHIFHSLCCCCCFGVCVFVLCVFVLCHLHWTCLFLCHNNCKSLQFSNPFPFPTSP